MTDNSRVVGTRTAELLAEHGYGPKAEFEGCTEEEITDIEDEFGHRLPEAYRSCLREIGSYAGGFQRGVDFFYPEMKYQREHAEARIKEHDVEFSLTETEFVFLGLQGYLFAYFDVDDGEDPPVYQYMEGDESGDKQADSFSEWLFEEIRR